MGGKYETVTGHLA